MASPSCLCCAVILPLRFAIFFSLHSTDFHLFTAQSLKFTVCLILSFFSFFFLFNLTSFTSPSTMSSSTSDFPTAPWLTSPTVWETSSTNTLMSAVTPELLASRSNKSRPSLDLFNFWPVEIVSQKFTLSNVGTEDTPALQSDSCNHRKWTEEGARINSC